jgi:hypothetical protein
MTAAFFPVKTQIGQPRSLIHKAKKEEVIMIRNMLYFAVTLALLTVFAEKSNSIEFNSLADQSSFRCSEGVVAIGDLDRDVREKCGDPLRIGRRQDFGPVWIYYEDQANFMYYLVFLHGNLQRIVSAPCSPDNPECFDLR